jgi:Tol biopolymer transport system component
MADSPKLGVTQTVALLPRAVGAQIAVVARWDAPVKQSDPSTLPPSSSYRLSWSPDGRFLAVPHATSPYVTIYDRSGATFTKITNPGSLPTGTCLASSWSPDGRFLALTQIGSPYINIYERSGATFTKLSNPATLPSSNPAGAPAWSPDGRYLAVFYTAAAPIIYERTGTTFTSVTQTISLSGTGMRGGAWSQDGTLLAMWFSTGVPLLRLYRIGRGVIGTQLGVVGPPTDPVNDGSWSPDGRLLAVAHDDEPNLDVYRLVDGGGGLIPIGYPADTEIQDADACTWSPDGSLLAMVQAFAPRLNIYRRHGTGLIALAVPVSAPGSSVPNGVAWSPDGRFVAMTLESSPYINIYETGATSRVHERPIATVWR